MTLITYFLPLIGAAFGYLISFLIISSLFKKDELEKNLMSKLKEIDFEPDFHEILDKYLTRFVGTLKQQIPMASMYLTGSLSERLKNLAKQEFIKMTPDVKEKILTKFTDNSSIFKAVIKKRAKKVCLISAFIGFLLGLFLICFC